MKIRDYPDYAAYLAHQTDKSQRIKAGECDEAGDYEKRLLGFKLLFAQLEVTPGAKALCLGARRGEEVQALREIGVDAIGLDLVGFPPLVHHGDMGYTLPEEPRQ